MLFFKCRLYANWIICYYIIENVILNGVKELVMGFQLNK